MRDIINKVVYYSNNIKKLNNSFDKDHIKILKLISTDEFNFKLIINDKIFKDINNKLIILKELLLIEMERPDSNFLNSKTQEIKDDFVDFLAKYFIKKRIFYLYIYVLLNSKNNNTYVQNNIDDLNKIKKDIEKTNDPNKKKIIESLENTINNLNIQLSNEKNIKEEYKRFVTKIIPAISNIDSWKN